MSTTTYDRSNKAVIGNGISPDEVNQQSLNHKALMEGLKGFEKLAFEQVISTLTGTQDNVNFDSGAVSPVTAFGWVHWNGASDVTVRGIAGGLAGRQVLLENIGTKTLILKHQDTNSTAANRLMLPGGVSNQAIGPGGRVMLLYDATQSRYRVAVLDEGDWISVAFSAGNFTGSASMTWTVAAGDQTVYRYKQRGTRLTVQVLLVSTTVGGTPDAELRVTLPNSLAVGGTGGMIAGGVVALNNGVVAVADIRTTPANTYLAFRLTGGGNWSAATDNTLLGVNTEIDVA